MSRTLTIHHVLHGFWVVFAEINYAGLGFSEWIAARAVEEA